MFLFVSNNTFNFRATKTCCLNINAFFHYQSLLNISWVLMKRKASPCMAVLLTIVSVASIAFRTILQCAIFNICNAKLSCLELNRTTVWLFVSPNNLDCIAGADSITYSFQIILFWSGQKMEVWKSLSYTKFFEYLKRIYIYIYEKYW